MLYVCLAISGAGSGTAMRNRPSSQMHTSSAHARLNGRHERPTHASCPRRTAEWRVGVSGRRCARARCCARRERSQLRATVVGSPHRAWCAHAPDAIAAQPKRDVSQASETCDTSRGCLSLNARASRESLRVYGPRARRGMFHTMERERPERHGPIRPGLGVGGTPHASPATGAEKARC